ncbi:MAG: hypothetical protein UW35_C0005G0008 [Candidatus Collierbacteria bacterium GW2011_GWF2_44_15]|uniref:Uncharacterized protein n=4 Tax=Candidatus Collieribacteriota TaxID=1752725 RepID=A0A0G1HI52_9BACT|nr:MAG: hypothetical protein UW23_C0033G0007 [Candidatus Collierbacteria bacterium GW2011_GWA1_44_12]KKT38342.1 MAG: hypothetical protein UW26_C0017G0007 [Candidatus Collierbacteria bacterium GW2011_GWF1_44_12]KKT46931.1 MAG: hypothetical protein UW35_C0005G0008 [Candidatus Collierbacteria bacterium GW2011_GWF2_44_15]KKT98820.1 MAG: hypothetical protein UW99_C0017G0007 [Candidatus Collierbacteria bacterium GW2011_GWC2_45_15]
MIVSSKETGRSYDLGARMLQSIDVIRILRHEPDNWILFQHETGIYLDDERANWIRLLATHSSSMPRAKAIDVCKSQNICDLAAALHETGHVVLGHCESPDETYVGGIRRMMSQENEASEYAIQEFIIMANEIGLDQGEVIRAKRLLDVLYYSYVIGYEKRFGLGKFDGIRELNITTQEVELVRIMFEWLVNLYK